MTRRLVATPEDLATIAPAERRPPLDRQLELPQHGLPCVSEQYDREYALDLGQQAHLRGAFRTTSGGSRSAAVSPGMKSATTNLPLRHYERCLGVGFVPRCPRQKRVKGRRRLWGT